MSFEAKLRPLLQPLSGRATVAWTIGPRVSWVNVDPGDPGACAFSVAWSTHEIVIEFGDGERVELGPVEDQDLACEMVSAIIAGEAFVSKRLWSRRVWLRTADRRWLGRNGLPTDRHPPEGSMTKYQPF